VRRDGVPLSEVRPEIADAAIDGLWHDVDRLLAAGVAHSRIDLDRVVARADGTLGFGDLSSGAVMIDPATQNRIAGADPRRDCYAIAY